MKWVKISPETMPPERKPVLVTCVPDGEDGPFVWPHECCYKDGYWFEHREINMHQLCSEISKCFTHWCAMPDPAKI